MFMGLLCLHFIIKDRYFHTGVIFYATPLPLTIIMGFVISLFFLRNRKTLIFLIAVNLGVSIYFFTHYFGSPIKPNSGKTYTALLWNVAENRPLPTDILIKHIKETNADVVALIEAYRVSNDDKDILESAFPEYEFKALYGTMLIGVRGSIENITFKAKTNVCKLNYITAMIDQEKTHILMVDINAVPMIDKAIPLGIVDQYLKNNEVNIMLGDFNTPYESIFFKPFKTDLNSFHPYSIGMSSTWPLPTPVIEIDQIWVDKSFQPIKLKKYAYPESDHKMLVGYYQKKM